jgi:hypothetical protein
LDAFLSIVIQYLSTGHPNLHISDYQVFIWQRQFYISLGGIGGKSSPFPTPMQEVFDMQKRVTVGRLVAAFLLVTANIGGAYSQTSVLNFGNETPSIISNQYDVYSLFEFDTTMLLTSIGFASDSRMLATVYSYELEFGGESLGVQTVSHSSLGEVDANGIRWYDFAQPLDVSYGTLKIRNKSGISDSAWLVSSTPLDSAVEGVRYEGTRWSNGTQYISSGGAFGNIRVQNPGSNVAPEPGTFALALTGGAALIGICIRRRRNAA